MAKKKSNRFAGRTARSMEKTKNDFGYLKLPENVTVFKPEGSTEIVFDVLPYRVTDPNHMDNKKYKEDAVEGELWWKKPIRVHRDVGPDGVSVICPTTVGKPCPICEDGARKRKAGVEWDELKEIFPKNRTLFLINPVDFGDCEVDYEEGELHLMDQSDYLFLNFLEEELKRDIDNEGFPDHEDGLSLQVYWRGKKLGKNKYSEASKIDFVERDEQYDDEYVDDLPSLDDMIKILPYKEIEALYLGMEGMDDDDEDHETLADDDDEPRTHKRKTPRSSRSSSTRKERPSRKTREEPEPEVEKEPEPEVEEPYEDPGVEKKASRRAARTPAKEKPARRSTRKPKEEEIEEAEVVEEVVEEKKKPARRSSRAAKPKENKCPFDHQFGEDTDAFDDCDKCKIWEECKDEKDAE